MCDCKRHFGVEYLCTCNCPHYKEDILDGLLTEPIDEKHPADPFIAAMLAVLLLILIAVAPAIVLGVWKAVL